MAEDELDAELEGRVWQFLADVRDGTAQDRPDIFELARWLAISWRLLVIDLDAKGSGRSPEEAQAAVDQLIDDQRLLCASLAASSDSTGPSGGGLRLEHG